MKVNGISENNYKKQSFAGWSRSVYKIPNHKDYYYIKEVKHRNDTCFFRGSNWNFLINLIETKYKNAKKVNIYDYGCSNGEESLSLVMKILTDLKEESEKFFPILAYDYDSYAIEKAMQNSHSISYNEQAAINFHTKNNFDKFFTLQKDFSYKANDIISKHILYKVADALNDSKRIGGDNNIVFARNFWPYLAVYDRYKFAKNLYEHIGKNSLLVIGEFDLYEYDESIIKILTKSGFKAVQNSSTIYIKQDEF